jgi:hypothetical protein
MSAARESAPDQSERGKVSGGTFRIASQMFDERIDDLLIEITADENGVFPLLIAERSSLQAS